MCYNIIKSNEHMCQAPLNVNKRKKGKLMNREQRVYIAIDLKSFYASVECIDRNLDPLKTNLVVADKSRTEKTICLAVTPSLKSYGIPGRARLFEVVQKVKDVNSSRKFFAPNKTFIGKSHDSEVLKNHPELAVSYIVAPPRMARYIKYSTEIYNIYLKYIAPEDIHVYSIDEVFMDVTNYLKTYDLSPRELAMKIIHDVLETTGITATAGIGTNLYLCKVAMDIVAKHIPADKDGVRIAELNEMSYRKLLWNHKPITDFWRVGRGYASKLEQHGMYTMGDVAKCSVGKENEWHNEDLLYKLFGVNAELLIDHAWGWEPCTIADIKAYKPSSNSISSGQVLQEAYSVEKARIVLMEMADQLALDLAEKEILTDQIVITIGYDRKSLDLQRDYKGEITTDLYGRKIPKHAHGTVNFDRLTSSTKLIVDKAVKLFDKITDKNLLVRRLNITANHIKNENSIDNSQSFVQLNFFTDYDEAKEEKMEKEKNIQMAIINIKKRFGKNALIKGMNLYEGATAISRNSQIGGHRA